LKSSKATSKFGLEFEAFEAAAAEEEEEDCCAVDILIIVVVETERGSIVGLS